MKESRQFLSTRTKNITHSCLTSPF